VSQRELKNQPITESRKEKRDKGQRQVIQQYICKISFSAGQSAASSPSLIKAEVLGETRLPEMPPKSPPARKNREQNKYPAFFSVISSITFQLRHTSENIMTRR
jgi:hypothetical protein